VASAVVSTVALTSPEANAFVRRTLGTIHYEILAFNQPDSVIGFWTAELKWYRIPVIVTFFLLLVATAIWPRRKNVEHLTAFSAAILVATQFWYPIQGGVYLLWYVPLLLVVVFRPRLAHLAPHEATAALPATRASSLTGPHGLRATSPSERKQLFR
jgi:hypothetical protein